MKTYSLKYFDLFLDYTIIFTLVNNKNTDDLALTPYLSLIRFTNGTKLFKNCLGLSLTWVYYSIAIGIAKENKKEQNVKTQYNFNLFLT